MTGAAVGDEEAMFGLGNRNGYICMNCSGVSIFRGRGKLGKWIIGCGRRTSVGLPGKFMILAAGDTRGREDATRM
jgi:hypothetical protein